MARSSSHSSLVSCGGKHGIGAQLGASEKMKQLCISSMGDKASAATLFLPGVCLAIKDS